MNSLFATTFKLTRQEILSAAASTILLNRLKEMGVPERSVAELCDKPQYGYTTSAASEPVGPRLVRITDIQAGAINWSTVPYCECGKEKNYQLMHNDILVARTGASVGKSFLVKSISESAIFASYLIRLQALKGETNSEYLYWCFQSQQFWKQILKASRGSAIKNVNGKMLSALSFPIPNIAIQIVIANFLNGFWNFLHHSDKTIVPRLSPKFAKQQRIVAKIEQLAAKVEEAQNLNTSALKQTESILWTAKNKIFNKDSSLEWAMMRLGEAAPVNMGQSPPGHSYNSEGEGIPLLNGPTEFGEEYPKEVQWTTEPTKFCKEGDLLICVRGATTGRTNWADKEYCIGRGLAALTVNQEVCLPKYVYHFITFSTQKLLALSAGSTFPNLPGAKLKALKISCPPIEEQRRIVAYLDNLQAKVDSLKHFQAQTQTELDVLLPSILDKAFKGEL